METSLWKITFERNNYQNYFIIKNRNGHILNININFDNDNLKNLINCLENGKEFMFSRGYTRLTIDKDNMIIKFSDKSVEFKAVFLIEDYKDILIKEFSEW